MDKEISEKYEDLLFGVKLLAAIGAVVGVGYAISVTGVSSWNTPAGEKGAYSESLTSQERSTRQGETGAQVKRPKVEMVDMLAIYSMEEKASRCGTFKDETELRLAVNGALGTEANILRYKRFKAEMDPALIPAPSPCGV